jgi:hypothetical protein
LREIQAGHFKVIWLVGAGLGLAAGFGYRPAFALAASCLITYAGIYRGWDLWLGLATGIGAIALLVMGTHADITTLASATLLGAVTNAMLLGHWHLNQPRLGTQPILRLVYALWVGLAVYLAATVYIAVTGSSVAALGAWTALAFTVFAVIMTAPVHHLVRTRSIMSATGILYLEILLCVVAAFTGTLGALSRSVG